MPERDKLPNVLPGFEFTVPPARPGEQDMTDEKVFTGEVLFRQHPDVFKAVAAAFFLDGLSIRAVAARYRVSVNTVRTIRDMALEAKDTNAGRVAFFIKSKADKLKGIIHIRSLEAIYDRLSDPKKAGDIPVDTLIKLANGTVGAGTDKNIPASSEIIDVEEFETVIDGLERGKKSARKGSSEPPENCSTPNENIPSRSVEHSNVTLEHKGFNETLCNSVCNGLGVEPNDADSPLKPPPPQGAGGTPGAMRDGGLD